MKALFVHNHEFVVAGGSDVYGQGQFGYESWRRYLDVFDELTVVGRVREQRPGESVAGLSLASGPRVRFAFVPSLSGPRAFLRHKRRVVAALADAVDEASAVIARLPSGTAVVAASLAERLGKPHAVEVVGCPWDALWNYGTWLGKAYAPVRARRVRQAVRRAPFALYVTREFLQSRYPTRGCSTVASNVQIPDPDPAALERRRLRIASAKRPLVFGLIGSLKHTYKGVHTALEAFERARSQLPPFEFRVLGPGDPAPWRRLAKARGVGEVVRFCGTLPSGPPVLNWLDDVDVYLQPSFQEGLPRTLIEAMSRGCPAVASTAGGIPELLSRDCLHTPGDARRLAELIVAAGNDRQWQAVHAERNFDVAQQYASEVLTARRREFWNDFARFAAQRGRYTARSDAADVGLSA